MRKEIIKMKKKKQLVFVVKFVKQIWNKKWEIK